jgi:hypothetical protein
VDIVLSKDWKNHQKGDVLRDVTDGILRDLVALGVVAQGVVAPLKGQGDTVKDVSAPPRDKMFRPTLRKDGET